MWRELFTRSAQTQFEILGLVQEPSDQKQVEQIMEYLKSMHFESLQVALIPRNVMKDYKLFSTPITLVVDNNGVVEKNWLGKWEKSTLNLAESYFGLSLSAGCSSCN